MSTAEPGRAVNPWVSIWLSPRATIRWLSGHPSRHPLHLLIAVMVFADMVCGMMSHESNARLSLETRVVMAAVMAPPYMILYLYVFGGLLRGTGRLLGGRATAVELRTVLAWAVVPSFVSALLLIAEVLWLGQGSLRSDAGSVRAVSGALYYTWASDAMAFVLCVWGIVILVEGVSEVQGFARWKAFTSGLLALGIGAALLVGLAVYCVGFS